MAQDMAQGQQMPPQEAAAQGGAAEGSPQEGGEQFASLVQNVVQGVAMLKEVVADAGVDPQVAELLTQADELVNQAVQGMMQAGQRGAQAGGDQGMATMEAGGANAQPMSPATR